MRRIPRLIRFELGLYLRRLSTWVFFAVLVGLSFLVMNVLGGAFSDVTASIAGSDGTVSLNSPFVLMQLMTLFGIFGILVVAAIAGNAGYRDFGDNIHPLVFTTPATKAEYIVSRYLGALAVSLVVLTGFGVGCWLGTVVPWIDAERFGENSFAAYLRPYLLLVIPNVLLTSAIFFSLALWTRKRLPHYLGGVGLLLGYLVAGALLGDLELKWAAALADPFGSGAMELATKYWTPIEKNTRLLGLEGWVLVNRLLWSGVGLCVLLAASWRVRLNHGGDERRRRSQEGADAAATTRPAATRIDIPTAHRSFGWRAASSQLLSLSGRAFREVVFSLSFVAILLGGLLFLFLSAAQLETIFGTRTWPLTWKVIEVLGGSFTLFVLILLTLYGGELVWRERDLKLDQVVDSTPTPSWVSFLSKLIALSAVVFLLLGVVMLSGIVTQAALGFFRFEIGLYVQKLFGMQSLDYLLLAVFSLAVHTLVNHKYTGHFLLVLFYLGIDLAPALGIEHAMWRFGSDLGQTYSDMNQHGWFSGPFLWFKLYWAGAAILLAILSNLLWPRGIDGRIRSRLATARLRTRTAVPVAAIAGVVVTLSAGGYVYYNTNVLNTYQSSSALEHLQVRYEKEYKEHEKLAQPRIAGVNLEVDLYPSEGQIAARGVYQLVNRTGRPIALLHLLIDSDAEIRDLRFARGAELHKEDAELGYHIYELSEALEPGATTSLEFDLFYPRRGFAHNVETAVVDNGTFVNSSVLPSFGYDPNRELALDRRRKRHGLEPKERMPDLDDAVARNDNYISRDADWVDFEVVVSTEPDQIALSPGYLQREWEEGGRRYFHYKMDAPILNFFSFLSARYDVIRDQWKDVAIEVFHHGGHKFNIDRMIASVKASLDYFSREFSPYQHRQLRIIEFPRYASFAQAFPNTVPYSEAIGFIARVSDDDIDYPFYVTAHEVAHQWWAHQIIGGNVQGATVLSETLAQYSALMVMKHEFGADKIRRFLEYELDQYLSGRSAEVKKEVPLLRVENQPYIHYRKGSLVMYAIQDAVGEDAVNRALAQLLTEWAFRGPPYPTSRDLLSVLLEETPEDLRRWVRELFEHITLYDHRATGAVARATADGRYAVTLDFQSRKLRAGEQGEEVEVALDDPVDIGIFGADGEVLYLEKHRLKTSPGQVTVEVSGTPARAGVDPYHKLIDRHPDDNEIRVRLEEPAG